MHFTFFSLIWNTLIVHSSLFSATLKASGIFKHSLGILDKISHPSLCLITRHSNLRYFFFFFSHHFKSRGSCWLISLAVWLTFLFQKLIIYFLWKFGTHYSSNSVSLNFTMWYKLLQLLPRGFNTEVFVFLGSMTWKHWSKSAKYILKFRIYLYKPRNTLFFIWRYIAKVVIHCNSF